MKHNSVDFASIVRTQNDRTGPSIVVANANAFVPIEHFPGRRQFTGDFDGLVLGTAELDVNTRDRKSVALAASSDHAVRLPAAVTLPRVAGVRFVLPATRRLL
jgi:hypothetical protein